jgi:hypothetical protein
VITRRGETKEKNPERRIGQSEENRRAITIDHLPSVRARHLVSLAGFLLLSVVWTWPVAAHLSTRVPHDLGDPVLNTWILWWNARAIPFTSAWWSPPILIPLRGALALSEHLAGLSLFATPIQLSGGSPLLAYNSCLLLSYALSGWCAYLLVFRLTGSTVAAVCGGVAFATAPYRAGQLAHLQVLTSQWMPVVLLGMHGYLSSGRRRWLALFAGSWLLQALSNGYYLLFFPVLIGLWLAWFVDWRQAPRRGIVLTATWFATSLPLVPVLLEYQSVHSTLGLSRMPGEVARFSASAASFLHAPPLLAFWPTQRVETQEDYLFPGVTAIAITALGLLTVAMRVRRADDAAPGRSADPRRQYPTFLFYAIATVVMWACAFGPGQETAGLTAWLHPYRWLTLVPGFEGLRVPARFAMLGSLCLAVAAGLAISRIESLAWRAFPAVAALVLTGLSLDGLMQPVPVGTPPPRAMLPAPLDAPVLELPADDARVNVAAMYRAIEHGRPIVNGDSGYTPPHYAILSLALRRGDPSPIGYLARGRPLIVIVNDQFDAGGEFRTMVERVPSIERIAASSAGTIFRLPAQPREAPPVTGSLLTWRLRDAGGERLEIDLDSTRVVRAVTFNLRWHYRELGERLLVERSDDGQVWEQAWLGWTGALAVAAAVEDPLVAPVRIPLPDIRVRYLRIYPAPRWLGRELTVIGP